MGCSRDMLNCLWGGKGLKNRLDDGSMDVKMLWRHTGIVYFLKMLTEKTNVLPHVSKWKDPFEGVIFGADYEDEDGRKVGVEEVYARFFGQCWSLDDCDTELMWNARSPDGFGVCLKTNVQKLKKALAGLSNVENPPAVVVAEMRYKKMRTIKRIVEDMGRNHKTEAKIGRLSENGVISLFFLKRDVFKAEKEFRIVVNVGENGKKGKQGIFEVEPDRFGSPNVVCYPIDPTDFIDEVILDPRMPEGFDKLVEKLRDDNGWKFKVTNSKLYEYITPKPTIRVYR